MTRRATGVRPFMRGMWHGIEGGVMRSGGGMFVRTMTPFDRISVSPEVMLGKPVIRGTRITVEHILEELAAGMTLDELLDAHPRLTREDLQAAIDYAIEAVRHVPLAAAS